MDPLDPSGQPSNSKIPWNMIGIVVLVLAAAGFGVLGVTQRNQQRITATSGTDGGLPVLGNTSAPAAPPSGSATTQPAASPSASATPKTTATTSSPRASATAASVKTINNDAVAMSVKTSGYCQYAAPDDWAAASDNTGTGIDINKTGMSEYAGWTISPIDRSMEAYYGPRYSDPETSNLAFINQLLTGGGFTADASYISDSQALPGGYFNVRYWQSSQKKGLILYHIYPNPDVAVAYISSTYIAATDRAIWGTEGGIATSVAVSIRCTSQLRPSGSGSSGDSHSSTETDNLEKSNYNAQLGTETVHDPKTGENFDVRYATDYNASGPAGPGYYRTAGNETRKMDSGINY